MVWAPKVRLIHVFFGLFGSPVETQGLGQCLIVLEPQFNRDWEMTLSSMGFSCIFDVLDGFPAVFVPLNSCLEVLH